MSAAAQLVAFGAVFLAALFASLMAVLVRSAAVSRREAPRAPGAWPQTPPGDPLGSP